MWVSWYEWGPCSAASGSGSGYGTRRRSRLCNRAAAGACDSITGRAEEVGYCGQGPSGMAKGERSHMPVEYFRFEFG